MEWHKTSDELPPEKVLVLTKTESNWGSMRSVELRRKGSEWFFPDWSQRTYYVPDYWKIV